MPGHDFSPIRPASPGIGRLLVPGRMTAPVDISPPGPIVSFTFDGVPRSALAGAEILERVGSLGGFHVSTSTLSQRNLTFGDMIRPEDIAYLAQHGHEIGAHTHTYLDCTQASPEVAEADVIANFAFLRAAGAPQQGRSLAYPFGEASPAVRQWAAQRFLIARGAQPGVNARVADRSQLRANLITSHEADRTRARRLIADCIRSKGWLIFFTHDVRSAPSEMGISLRHFAELAQIARDGGAALLPPVAAATACGIVGAPREAGYRRVIGDGRHAAHLA
jgi:peptidoglycan/xylan/chitin deacetylase (PgdA/CDA1 family)